MKLPKAPGYVDDPRQRDDGTPQVGVSAGDEVFYRRSGSHCVGTILCHGRDGFTIRGQGGPHVKVPWQDYVGHKTRVNHQAKIVHQGEDGALADLEDGRRVYLFGYPEMAEEEPELKKATILLLKSGPIKNRPGLTLKPIADKAGRQSKHWVKTGDDPKKGRKAGDDRRGSAKGYGTHRMDVGDAVTFDNGQGGEQSGKIVAAGKDGAMVETPHGRVQVRWDQIRKPPKPPKPPRKDGGAAPGGDPEPSNWRQQPAKVKPADFKAGAHYQSTDDADVTPESVMSNLTDVERGKVTDAVQRLKTIEETIALKDGNQWGEERDAIHQKIIFGADERGADGELKYPGILTPAQVQAATPKAGERPSVTFLGGRGGSGKSAFKGSVYDPNTAIVLDADAIKKQLPEYAGWNAYQLHEESSELVDAIKTFAMSKGLNLVVDATLRTPDKALKQVGEFKDKGYHVAVHFMHVARAEAARRALQRFMGKEGRFVPPDVILSNTSNEDTFDRLRPHADEWSFWDNNGAKPQLISHSHADRQGG